MVKVLIVDDSQTLRQMVNELLTKQAIKVIEAASGLEAKEKIQEDPPDLALRVGSPTSAPVGSVWDENERDKLSVISLQF